jgi:hypothetical protein
MIAADAFAAIVRSGRCVPRNATETPVTNPADGPTLLHLTLPIVSNAPLTAAILRSDLTGHTG